MSELLSPCHLRKRASKKAKIAILICYLSINLLICCVYVVENYICAWYNVSVSDVYPFVPVGQTHSPLYE